MTEQRIENHILKTALLDIDSLTPLQGDLKKLSDENFNKLRKSLIEKGFQFTVHVWEQGGTTYIIDGHQRVHVMKQLRKAGWEVPPITCSFVKAATYHDAKELILYAVSQYGKLDKEGFDAFIEDEDFELAQFDFPDFSFDPLEISLDDENLNESLTDSDDAPDVDETKKPISKLGDLWILGNHRLLCGDSTNSENVFALMNEELADLIFTDPPYNIASHSKNFSSEVSKSMSDLKNSEWDKNFDVSKTIKIIESIIKKDATIYIWTSHFLIQKIFDALNLFCDFVGYCIWSKPNPMPSLSKRHWTWNTELCVYASIGSGDRVVNFPESGHALSTWQVVKKSDGSHPTQKPIDLITPVIEFSSNKNQLVVDLFLGSGSTLIACEKTNRKCYGMELDPKYCDVIIKRWQDFSGKKACRHDGIYFDECF